MNQTKNMKLLENKIQRLTTLSILISFCLCCGCTDSPYTKSIMTSTVDDYWDNYFTINEDGEVCYEKDGTVSSCIKLIPKGPQNPQSPKPHIHLHVGKTVYVFYHEGVPVIEAVYIPPQSDDDEDQQTQSDMNPSIVEVPEPLIDEIPPIIFDSTDDNSGTDNNNNGGTDNNNITPPPINPNSDGTNTDNNNNGGTDDNNGENNFQGKVGSPRRILGRCHSA